MKKDVLSPDKIARVIDEIILPYLFPPIVLRRPSLSPDHRLTVDQSHCWWRCVIILLWSDKNWSVIATGDLFFISDRQVIKFGYICLLTMTLIIRVWWFVCADPSFRLTGVLYVCDTVFCSVFSRHTFSLMRRDEEGRKVIPRSS